MVTNYNIKQHQARGYTDKTVFYLAIILPLFSGFGNAANTLVSFMELCILLYYIKSYRFYSLLPVFYIYYSQLKVLNIVFFNIYIVLAIMKFLLFERRSKKNSVVLGLLVLIIYAGIVLFMHDEIAATVLFFWESIVSLMILMRVKDDKQAYNELKWVLVAISISAMLYGVLFRNFIGAENVTNSGEFSSGRYMGTKGDPNYMALYYCLSFAVVLFASFKYNLVKWMLAIVLFAGIALTGSITALFVYAITVLLYILFAKESNITKKFIGVCGVIIAVTLFIGYIQSDSDNIPILNVFKVRLLEKVKYWLADDLSGLTTGRTELSQLYIDYLFKQNIFRILFGGYQLNALALKEEIFKVIGQAAHNTYVDVMLTCGVVGLVLFVMLLVKNIKNKVEKWRYNKTRENMSDIAMSVVLMLFMFGLSLFPSTEYMFFLFF